MANADTVYFAGFNGTILKTMNGGMAWFSVNSGTTSLYGCR